MKLIDITRELLHGPTYPGDPVPQVQALSRVSMGDPCNTTAISMCLHNGTHMDAPRHFFNAGEAVDKIALETCIGECVVLECNGLLLGDRAEELLPYLKKRVLFKGDVQLTPSAAFVLSTAGVLLIGVEQPSVAPVEYTAEVHRQLLQSGMVLLENLDLTDAEVGETYLLMAAPLKIAGADGAPVRAVLAESDRIDWDGRVWQ